MGENSEKQQEHNEKGQDVTPPTRPPIRLIKEGTDTPISSPNRPQARTFMEFLFDEEHTKSSSEKKNNEK